MSVKKWIWLAGFVLAVCLGYFFSLKISDNSVFGIPAIFMLVVVMITFDRILCQNEKEIKMIKKFIWPVLFVVSVYYLLFFSIRIFESSAFLVWAGIMISTTVISFIKMLYQKIKEDKDDFC